MKVRILVCLGVLLAFCLWGDGFAVVSLHRSTRQLERLSESHRIQSMRGALASQAVHLQAHLLTRTIGESNDPTDVDRDLHQIKQSLQGCRGCHHEPRIQAKLDDIGNTFHAYAAAAHKVEAAATGEASHEAEVNLVNVAIDLVSKATGVSEQAMKHLSDRSAVIAADLSHARMVLWITVILTLLAGGVVALHLQRSVTIPIADLLEGIDRAREGDLSRRVTIRADKEFRMLGTAFNEAYESLKNAQDAMLQAEKMAAVGKLAAGVAHEVGNPLASISSIAQIMRRRCDSAEQREQFDLIMAQINRITKIVRDLLKFSRPAGSEERTLLSVGDLIDNAATLLRYDSRAGAIGIECRHDPDLGLVWGDGDRLLLVFTNIMLNAFDAMEDGCDRKGDLIITTHATRDSVVIRFDDSGPGMTNEQIANAFEPFFTTKEPDKGTGLGLWICYQVIRGHDGTIRIESLSGEGTTVTIELPSVSPDDYPPADADRSQNDFTVPAITS